jgi:hypothetical protein
VSVEFEPVKLGPRRRRVDPVAIGTLIVVIGLGAAVAKPWNAAADPASGGADSEDAGSTPAPSLPRPSVAPSPAIAAVLPRILRPVTTASYATWGEVRAAVRPHDAWGIRAIVGRPSALLAPAGDLSFAEIWNGLPVAPRNPPPIDIEPNDQTVVAIGITFPAAHTPIDARIWLVHPDRLEWIDSEPLDPNPASGGFLYRSLGADGLPRNWTAGRYRLDVLVDGGIRRFGFTLPNRFEIVPDGSEPAPVPAGLIDPAGGALPDLPVGLFMTASGVSIPLRASAGPPLGEVGAWLDVDPGTNRAPRSHVASVFAPAATGLGVRLPDGSLIERSTLVRLAPEPLAGEPELVGEAIRSPPPPAHVLYRPPGGGAWLPGVYQLSVAWTDAAGHHDRSWHVELLPGPNQTPSAMLVAARRLARFAGAAGVALGTAEPLEGGPRWVTIRLLRAGQASRTGIPQRDRVPCDGVRIDGLSGVIGLAGPATGPPPKVTARVLFEFNRSGEQPLLTAAGDVPGLTLVAPAGEPPQPSDAYQLRVDDTTNPAGASVCLSLTPAG